MLINSVYGHWEANSYVSLAEADDYFARHPEQATWDYQAEASKEGALIHATRWLDHVPDFVVGARLFSEAPRAQALRHPTEAADVISGTATGGALAYLSDTSLANPESYRSNEFKYGSIEITGGTGIYSRTTITLFNVTTGVVSVVPNFDDLIDATSDYSIVYPLAADLKNAVCELALYITKGNFDQALNAAQMEQGAVTPLTVLPLNVQHLIGSTVAPRLEVRRA